MSPMYVLSSSEWPTPEGKDVKYGFVSLKNGAGITMKW